MYFVVFLSEKWAINFRFVTPRCQRTTQRLLSLRLAALELPEKRIVNAKLFSSVFHIVNHRKSIPVS
jgi:hypothetical protein